MKRIICAVISILALLLCSCSSEHIAVFNDDTTLTFDGEIFYPLQNSERFTDYGYSKKQTSVQGKDVYMVDGKPKTIFISDGESYTYYVTEEYRSYNKLFEEGSDYLYVPKEDLDKNGRVSSSYVSRADVLTGTTAEDFSFYTLYGRTPEENGYVGGEYVGEIICPLNDYASLAMSYSVYQYSPTAFSVKIDSQEYMLEIKWAREIGIM